MSQDRKINVLIVDDSLVARELISHILESGPGRDINIMGAVGSGEEALGFLLNNNMPDIITMDVYMPGLTGFETTRRIMEATPVPIVIVTSLPDMHSSINTFKMMEAGATAILEKPPGPDHQDYALKSKHFRDIIRAMSEVKVIKRWGSKSSFSGISPGTSIKNLAQIEIAQHKDSNSKELSVYRKNFQKELNSKIVAIGVSTGGPPLIQNILSRLPKKITVPIVIVQHIAPGFLDSMVGWLCETSALPIHIPGNGDAVLPGHVYFAPDNYHMGITEQYRVVLSRDKHECGSRPSVSYLFRSVLNSFGADSVAILLTGMGKDGARSMLRMKLAGSITIAQNQASCVVFGMPGNAIEIGAAKYILSPDEIIQKIVDITTMESIEGSL